MTTAVVWKQFGIQGKGILTLRSYYFAPVAQPGQQNFLPEDLAAHADMGGRVNLSSSHVLKMKGYIDNLERLGQPVGQNLATPPPPKKDNPAKDAICHQCGEVGHWRRNCPVYLAELMKNKKLSQGASASGSKKLKPGVLSLYVGDGHRAAVEAIGTYHLELSSGLFHGLSRFILWSVPRRWHFLKLDMPLSVVDTVAETIESYNMIRLLNPIVIVSLGKCVSCLSGPSENKVFVARNAEFFESKLLDLKASGSVEDLELIQEEEHNPLSTRTRHLTDRLCSYIDKRKHELGGSRQVAFQTFEMIRILIAIAAYKNMRYGNWMSNAFLNGHLSEEGLYGAILRIFVNPKYLTMYAKLKRSIMDFQTSIKAME
ncbi:zinc finger, CCHC-type containing protein [Tanacetum coccineum]